MTKEDSKQALTDESFPTEIREDCTSSGIEILRIVAELLEKIQDIPDDDHDINLIQTARDRARDIL